MLVDLVYPPLGLFICVVDLSYEDCPFIFVFVTNKVLICSTHVLYYVVVASSDCSQMAPSSPKKKTPVKKVDKRIKWTLTCSGMFPILRDTRISS